MLHNWSWWSFCLGIVATFAWFFGAVLVWWFFIIRKRGPLWREITQADFERVKRAVKSGGN